jgi:hypothetical protein
VASRFAVAYRGSRRRRSSGNRQCASRTVLMQALPGTSIVLAAALQASMARTGASNALVCADQADAHRGISFDRCEGSSRQVPRRASPKIGDTISGFRFGELGRP